MDTQLHTSFIPKKTIDPVDMPRRRTPTGLLILLGLLVFLISVGGWGGAYLYHDYLVKKVESERKELIKERESLDELLLVEFENISTKISQANELLNKHVGFSSFFTLLEQMTLPTVQFNLMTYENVNGMHKIQLSGEALSYESIALQSDEFARHPRIQNPIFSGFTVLQNRRIAFKSEFIAHPDLLSFRKQARFISENNQNNPSSSQGATFDQSPESNMPATQVGTPGQNSDESFELEGELPIIPE